MGKLAGRSDRPPSLDLYIMSSAIVGSILLYPAGGLAYIDALFFASGASTQSGLNTYARPL